MTSANEAFFTWIIIFAFSTSLATGQEFPAMIANSFTLPPIGALSPVAIENWSSGGSSDQQPPFRYQKYNGNFVDCSDTATTLCNQGAWADFGLAVSGLIPKYSLCTKYSPSTSCISTSLRHCNATLSETTNTMMIAFGRVVVSWCYDGGLRLTALDTQATCLSVAMFDALTIRNCLTQINDPTAVGKPAVSNDVADPQKTMIALPKLFNSVIDTYQSSTIICMHSSIAEACGDEAATLALGPAMDELMAPTAAPLSTTSSTKPSSSKKNISAQEEKDIYSKSRQFIERDYVNAAARPKTICHWIILLVLDAFCLHRFLM